MRCRPATPEDIPWLAATSAEIYARVFGSVVADFDPTPFDEAHFARRFREAWPRIRILAQEDERCGFHLLSDGNIDMMFVAAGTRRQGAGRALLRDAEAQGATRLECFAENFSARRFYEACGWRIAQTYERDFAGRRRAFVQFVR